MGVKELSNEEKAKRYDEAIKRIENIKTGKCEITFMFTEDLFEYIFPEFAESEDEKIRKEILDFCKNRAEKYPNDPKYKNISAWIDWLEKQCEKDKEILVLKDQIESLHAAIKAIKETHRIELEKQGEQNLANSAKTCKVEHKFNPCDGCVNRRGCINCENGELRETEQKSTAWSEEDEAGLSDALWCCKQAASIAKDENDMGNVWYAEHWLKSLKDRYAWNPSDEQMKALKEAVDEHFDIDGGALWHLYQELKNLKDEK